MNMRIISKHHDYYDCLQRQLGDRSIVFTRETVEHVLPNPFAEIRLQGFALQGFADNKAKISPQVLFFCGEAIPVLHCLISPVCVYPEVWQWVYSLDDLGSAFGVGARAYARLWIEEGQEDSQLAWCKDEKTVGEHLKWRTKCKKQRIFTIQPKSLRDYAIANGVAYFSLRIGYEGYYGNQLTHYPDLQKMELYRRIPAAEAFQRIQTFLTNDLAREKEMKAEPIPDTVKVEVHGFDKKTSFRKGKEHPYA